jgi:hypothetical protein
MTPIDHLGVDTTPPIGPFTRNHLTAAFHLTTAFGITNSCSKAATVIEGGLVACAMSSVTGDAPNELSG